ncbi:hypothetical protein [Streptomyces sp. Y1]|uniref:Uncharacterized protein n=1 Tax=Streptomyces sp. Y1 TaxID=3238634 RepID=A0AB39TDN8_9ACTN
MPRSRPDQVRARLPRHRTHGAQPVIDGVSARTLSAIAHLERTRTHLQPGAVARALRLWQEYVHRPERDLWDDYEHGSAECHCCGDPLEARALLDTVHSALPPRAARELRRIIDRSDALWGSW